MVTLYRPAYYRAHIAPRYAGLYTNNSKKLLHVCNSYKNSKIEVKTMVRRMYATIS